MTATTRIGTSLAAVALVAAGCGGTSGATATGQSSREAAPNYTLAHTKACLVKRGAKVGRVKPLDTRLRAFRDLAQRNSIQADFKTGRVGIAFVKSEADATLLVELLTVPRDPYRLVRRVNAVLIAKPAHRRAFTAAVACLRA